MPAENRAPAAADFEHSYITRSGGRQSYPPESPMCFRRLSHESPQGPGIDFTSAIRHLCARYGSLAIRAEMGAVLRHKSSLLLTLKSAFHHCLTGFSKDGARGGI